MKHYEISPELTRPASELEAVRYKHVRNVEGGEQMLTMKDYTTIWESVVPFLHRQAIGSTDIKPALPAHSEEDYPLSQGIQEREANRCMHDRAGW